VVFEDFRALFHIGERLIVVAHLHSDNAASDKQNRHRVLCAAGPGGNEGCRKQPPPRFNFPDDRELSTDSTSTTGFRRFSHGIERGETGFQLSRIPLLEQIHDA